MSFTCFQWYCKGSHINISKTGAVVFFSVLKGMLILVEHTDLLVEEPGFKNVKNKHLDMSPF